MLKLKEKFVSSRARLTCAICGSRILTGERVLVDEEGYKHFPAVYCRTCSKAIKEEVAGPVVKLWNELDYQLAELVERLEELDECRHF